MKTHNIEVAHGDACTIYDLLNEITFASRPCRGKPGYVTVSALTKWNLARLRQVMDIFGKIVNEED